MVHHRQKMTDSSRLESDSMGSIEVSNLSLWGAQTQRSLVNFAIGNEKVPLKLIYAIADIKKADTKKNSPVFNSTHWPNKE